MTGINSKNNPTPPPAKAPVSPRPADSKTVSANNSPGAKPQSSSSAVNISSGFGTNAPNIKATGNTTGSFGKVIKKTQTSTTNPASTSEPKKMSADEINAFNASLFKPTEGLNPENLSVAKLNELYRNASIEVEQMHIKARNELFDKIYNKKEMSGLLLLDKLEPQTLKKLVSENTLGKGFAVFNDNNITKMESVSLLQDLNAYKEMESKYINNAMTKVKATGLFSEKEFAQIQKNIDDTVAAKREYAIENIDQGKRFDNQFSMVTLRMPNVFVVHNILSEALYPVEMRIPLAGK